VSLDDCSEDPAVTQTRRDLEHLAELHGVRLASIEYGEGTPVQKYACLLHRGLFAAAYLDVGLV
jgi:hypothetical protein